MSYSCPGSHSLFNNYCSLVNNSTSQNTLPTLCGQFSTCTQLFQTNQPTGFYGCCRKGILAPNAAQIIIYIVIITVIGIGILGALGGDYEFVMH